MPKKRPPLKSLELRYPPMPQTLVEATQMMEHPQELQVQPVTRMVQRDPFVVARLLHTVNSAYYGLRNTIESAERAVVMLGPVAVAGIVVGMNMIKLRSAFQGPSGNCFMRLIKHSIATAFLSRHLLVETSSKGSNTAEKTGVSFTAGLLHDFGKMVLVYNYPQKATEFYDKHILRDQLVYSDIRRLEQLIFGCDHVEAGEYLARKLSFPDTLSDMIRFHHHPENFSGNAKTRGMITTVAAANQAAKTLGFGFDQRPNWEQCMSQGIWEADLFEQRYASEEQLKKDLVVQGEQLEEYINSLTQAF